MHIHAFFFVLAVLSIASTVPFTMAQQDPNTVGTAQREMLVRRPAFTKSQRVRRDTSRIAVGSNFARSPGGSVPIVVPN
ncbi:hypothetical protein AOL_s00097g537 [Orbilia oligospora ATCC 24927]|uniref:Uncharacterized protein n=1 Tax=Arthrobotrys oligospora (strain ATCC 24927 / CBS 115.81 / DSM 1491) TaxID=756982 RepID=G1XJL0_ARTOA|nr:hypothetical protein AOL_s00097g537 [Orbilia oligospora ATCC 24927]EGX46633.1 hypothetical protein AOL_s00097g537 [Orbilia oligospora ATCC 24927]